MFWEFILKMTNRKSFTNVKKLITLACKSHQLSKKANQQELFVTEEKYFKVDRRNLKITNFEGFYIPKETCFRTKKPIFKGFTFKKKHALELRPEGQIPFLCGCNFAIQNIQCVLKQSPPLNVLYTGFFKKLRSFVSRCFYFGKFVEVRMGRA